MLAVNKDVKKFLVCGASLLMMASLGAGTANVSARRVSHRGYRTALVSRNRRSVYKSNSAKRAKQFKSVQHYLDFVAKYNRTHANKWNSYYLRHLGRHMNYLSYSQKKILFTQLAKVNKVRLTKKYTKRAKVVKRNKRVRKFSYKRTVAKRNKWARKSVRRSKRVMTKKHYVRKNKRHAMKQRVRKTNKSMIKHYKELKPDTEVTNVKTYTPKKATKKSSAKKNTTVASKPVISTSTTNNNSQNNTNNDDTQTTSFDETDGGKYYSWKQLNDVLNSNGVVADVDRTPDQKIENTIYHNLNNGNYSDKQVNTLLNDDGNELQNMSPSLYNNILGSLNNAESADDVYNDIP